jgi:hypothetical protein
MRTAAGDDPDSGKDEDSGVSDRGGFEGKFDSPQRLAGEETGPTEEAQSVGDSIDKRPRVEGVGVGKKRVAEGGEKMLTAEESALSARPLPPREIPYPKSGDYSEVVAWMHASDALHKNSKIGDGGENLLFYLITSSLSTF